MGLLDYFRVKDFRIVLPSTTVYAGAMLQGHLEFECTSSVTMKAVRLKFSGKEKTTVRVGSGKHSHTFIETAPFLKQILTLSRS